MESSEEVWQSSANVSQGLSAMKEQISGLILKQARRLDKNVMHFLRNIKSYQQLKLINDLLYDCQDQAGLGLLCDFLMDNIILESVHSLHARYLYLKQYKNDYSRGLVLIGSLLDTYIQHDNAELLSSKNLADIWNQLPDGKRIAITTILEILSAGVGGGVGVTSYLKNGGRISSAGMHKLKRHQHALNRHLIKEKVLEQLKTGISLKFKHKRTGLAVWSKHKPSSVYKVKKIVGKKSIVGAPVVMNIRVNRNVELYSGHKVFVLTDRKRFLSSTKPIKLRGATLAFFLTAGGIGILSALANMQTYQEQGLTLGFWEKHKVWGRGFLRSFISIDPHPESVSQYLIEKEVANELASSITNFLKNTPWVVTYVAGLGRVFIKDGMRMIEPHFCFANLNDLKSPRTTAYANPRYYRGPKVKVTRYRQKSRKTPDLTDSATEFLCTPEFNAATEEEGSSLNDLAPYSCQNAFAISNKTRTTETPYAYVDLSFCNSANITGSQEQENIFDASNIRDKQLYFQNNLITTTPTDSSDKALEIETHNVDIFIGRPDKIDIIDFSIFPQSTYVATKGGEGSGAGLKDRLMNVPNALLSRYTYVYSILETLHEYDIELNHGAINIDLINANEVNLNFNVSMEELLKIVISQEKAHSTFGVALDSDFIKLSLILDQTEVFINLKKNANVNLSSDNKSQISFQADSSGSFLIKLLVEQGTSPEKKLQICHTYQKLKLGERQLRCLMLSKVEAETDIFEAAFFIDEQGQAWNLIISSDGNFDKIPFYGQEGTYSLTVSNVERYPRLSISFPLADLIYYRIGNDLILGRKNYDLSKFSITLKQYYLNPTSWNALRIVNLNTKDFFDCNIGENCFSEGALEGYSREAISLENEIKVREEQLFTYYLLTPEANVASQTIYHNQQLSDSGEWQAIRKKRFGYLKVEDFNLADIQVRAEGSDLIFFIEAASVGKNTFEFRFKNWDSSPSHRLEGIIFSGFISDNLSGFSSEDATLVERRLKKSIMKAKVYEEAKQLLSPLMLTYLKAFLLSESLAKPWLTLANNKMALSKALGFWNEEALAKFYLFSSLSPVKKDVLKLIGSELRLKKTTQALYWLLASTCLAMPSNFLANRLFSMLGPEEISNLCDVIRRSSSSQSTKQWIRASITPERLESIKTWLVKASNVNIVRYSAKPLTEVFYDPELDAAGDGPAGTDDHISHRRYVEGGDSSDTETQGFIDLSNKPDIVEVNVSWEWKSRRLKFTFTSKDGVNYRPMLINWGVSQRIEGIIKDEDIVTGLTELDDPALIEARINTVFSPEREWQVEEPRVGAQVHSAYQEEQMLGDQPVNGFIHEESHASHSMAPLQLSTNAANSPSLMGIITNGVEVNSNLLALQMLLGNKVSSRIPNFSIESQKEERIKALASTIIPKLIEYEENGEESETESASGFLNKLPLLGVLGAGVVSIIGGLVYWVKKRGAKNLPSNDDLEEVEIAPLNPNNANSVGNSECSLNLTPPTASLLFGVKEEREGGSEGSSSPLVFNNYPFADNHPFAGPTDYDRKIPSQKKTVKACTEERAA